MARKLNNYSYRGARALVLLHEKHLHHYLKVWKRPKPLTFNFLKQIMKTANL